MDQIAQQDHTPLRAPFATPDGLATAAMEALSEGVIGFDRSQHIRLLSRRAMALLGFGRGVASHAILPALLAASPRLDRKAVNFLIETCFAATTAPSEDPPLGEQAIDGAPGLLFALRRTTAESWVLRIAEAPLSQPGATLAPDMLTGLANRAMFLARLSVLFDRPAQRATDAAVLCIGLDGLSAIADTLGQDVADQLRVVAAQRLLAGVREQDLVARIADDEFAVLQGEAEESAAAGALARRLATQLGQPCQVGETMLGLGARIGIAVLRSDGADAEQLLRQAGLALRGARRHGIDAVRRFDMAMDVDAQNQLALEAALRRAVSEECFTLHYQPQVTLTDGRLKGFEALLRWTDPRHGMMPPLTVVPIAERLGLIDRLGAWVLRTACAEAARWPGALSVAVNVAPTQFASFTLVAEVKRALMASGLHPSRLELEITESVLLASDEGTRMQLNALRGYGIRLAMDDFGTGHSSFARLSAFPFDRLKIDRSFVQNLPDDDQAATILRAVAELSQRLGLATTAEGVETEEQLERLRGFGCTDVQGYLIGRPIPAAELPAVIARLSR